MLRPLLATAALGVLLASGAYAQDAPAVDPAPETTAPAPDAMAPAAPDAMAPAAPGAMAPAELSGDWVVDENYQPIDVATLTAEEIIGADVRNPDGEVVATVDDLVLGPEGKAQGVAAKFGGFLGFGTNTVLLQLDEVEIMQNDSGTLVLRTNVTPEDLEGRPDYMKD